MAYRNGNYSAFYVDGPFSESNLNAHATMRFHLLQPAQSVEGQRLFFSPSLTPTIRITTLGMIVIGRRR